MMFRVGIGYDIHRFIEKRKLFLGGVHIPYNKGLEGHSDADVIIHAICDAILGAMSAGDIGQLFPNTDKKYKNISSLKLLEKVYSLLQKGCFCVGNVDVMLLLEAPKITPFKKKIKVKIAKALKIYETQVSVKATTHEGVGELGRGEAAAAYAVVLIRSRRSL